MARRIYHTTPERDRAEIKREAAEDLSVSERTVRGWLSRIDKDAKSARNERIFALWMACHTQQAIADVLEVPQQTVADALKPLTEFGNLAESGKVAANHVTDFEVPLFNVWKFQTKAAASEHGGTAST